MPIAVHNLEGNICRASDKFLTENGGYIMFTGKGGTLEVGEDCYAPQIGITIGDNCSVVIGSSCRLGAVQIYTLKDSTVSIGDVSGFTWSCNIQCHESYDVTIGKGCLFAGNSWITVSDMHSVVDLTTQRRVNHGGHVRLGDRVWLGDGACVMKGVTIGGGSVVAARAVVTKDVPENCVVAGIPGKIVRKNASWDFRLL